MENGPSAKASYHLRPRAEAAALLSVWPGREASLSLRTGLGGLWAKSSGASRHRQECRSGESDGFFFADKGKHSQASFSEKPIESSPHSHPYPPGPHSPARLLGELAFKTLVKV
jgi:hypothetical protein